MLRNPASLSAAPTSTWAGLPAAASAQGQIFRVTDIGLTGIGLVVISDGTRWVPLGPQLLARSGAQASVTGTTNETVLATVTVPGNLMGINGGIEARSTWSTTNSANTKTLRVRFGGAAGVQYFNSGQANIASLADIRRIRNRGAAASQVGSIGSNGIVGAATVGVASSTLDTTVAQDLVFSAQLALGTESAAIENYEVWITP